MNTIETHETEIKANEALIADLSQTMRSMKRSIRMLTIENKGRAAAISMLRRAEQETEVKS